MAQVNGKPVQMYRGDDVEFPFKITHNGNELVYTDYDWLCYWRNKENDTDKFEAVVTATSATLSVTFKKEDTANMSGDGVFDLQSTSKQTGKVKTWAKVYTCFEEDVTR